MVEIIKSIITTDLGIAGLCVSGLLAVMVCMVFFNGRRDSGFRKEMRSVYDEHRQERKSWKEDSNKQNDLTREVIGKLETTIKEIVKG
jgi:hypothetical protein